MLTKRDIAVWAGSAPATGVGQEELWGLLELCDRVLRPFEAEGLLIVRSIVVDDWVDAGAPAAEPRGEHVIARATGDTIEATCRRYFAEQALRDTTSADLVTLEGTTIIHEADGTQTALTGALAIQGMLTGKNTIWIRTRTDAWLPRGLLGDEQRDRHALNAPRLRRALTQANDILGSLTPEPSKLAVVNGFELENLPVAAVRTLLDP